MSDCRHEWVVLKTEMRPTFVRTEMGGRVVSAQTDDVLVVYKFCPKCDSYTTVEPNYVSSY